MGVRIGAASQAANSVEIAGEYAEEKQVPKKQVPKDQGEATQVATRVKTLHKARSRADLFLQNQVQREYKEKEESEEKIAD